MRQEYPYSPAVVRIAGQATAKMPFGLGTRALVASENTQIVMGVGIVGIVLQGVRETVLRLVPPAKGFEDIAQIVVGVDMVRLERNRAFIARGGIPKPGLLLEHNGQV